VIFFIRGPKLLYGVKHRGLKMHFSPNNITSTEEIWKKKRVVKIIVYPTIIYIFVLYSLYFTMNVV